MDLNHSHSQEECFLLGDFVTTCLSNGTEEVIHRFSTSALVKMCFPSMFRDKMVVVLEIVFKTLLIVFQVFLRSPSQEAILCVKYSHFSCQFNSLTWLRIVTNSYGLEGGGGVLGLRTYGEVSLENLKSYPVPESNS